MATKRKRVNVSFTPEELTRVRSQAKRMGLSISELLRRLSFGYQALIPDDIPFVPVISQLLETNAEQARLGNQLKQVLDGDDTPLSPATIGQIETLIAKIRETQIPLRQGVTTALALIQTESRDL